MTKASVKKHVLLTKSKDRNNNNDVKKNLDKPNNNQLLMQLNSYLIDSQKIYYQQPTKLDSYF